MLGTSRVGKSVTLKSVRERAEERGRGGKGWGQASHFQTSALHGCTTKLTKQLGFPRLE